MSPSSRRTSIAIWTAAAIERQEGDGALDPWGAHRRIERMYSWHRVAVQTVRVYDRIIQDKPMTFLERLRRHQRRGGLSGIIVCALALYIELWVRFVEWMSVAQRKNFAQCGNTSNQDARF